MVIHGFVRWLIAVVLLQGALGGSFAYAQDAVRGYAGLLQSPLQSANSPVTVIFILDDSGSMKDSDSANLRYTAAQLFTALLDDGDRVGAIRFSDAASPITNGIIPINGAQSQTDLIARLAPAAVSGYTDVKAAFQAAEAMLGAEAPEGDVLILFLTDGKPEVANRTSAYEDEAVQTALRLGHPIYAIALTPSGQSGFLTRLIGQTGGAILPARTANDLLDSYLEVLPQFKGRVIVGTGAPPQNVPGSILFDLDPALASYVTRATFIASHTDGVSLTLQDPAGLPVLPGDPRVSFGVADARFDVRSISQPPGGSWQMLLEGRGAAQGRLVLHSSLRARIASPNGPQQAGQPARIVVSLIEDQPDGSSVKLVGEASFSAEVTLPDGSVEELDRFYDDGTNGDEIAGDGSFTRLFANTVQPGSYAITVRGSKGLVPVTAAARMEAVPFPALAAVEPALPRYEIRTQAVPLEMRLDLPAGGYSNADFEGEFAAQITLPGGAAQTVPLQGRVEAESLVFTAEFAPPADGVYTVSFQPQNAYFLGVPLNEETQATFEAFLVPHLSVGAVQTGEAALDGRFEVGEVQAGLPLLVTVRSTSGREEQVSAHLEGLPGFELENGGPFALPPQSEISMNLRMRPAGEVKPGSWQGKVVLVPQGVVDMEGEPPAVRFEAYQPRVTFGALLVETIAPKQCWGAPSYRLTLPVESTSRRDETFSLALEAPGLALSESEFTIRPGKSELALDVTPVEGGPQESQEAGLVVGGGRAGLQVEPAKPLPVAFERDPLVKACQKPLIFSGGGLLFLVMIGALMVGKKIKDGQPIDVTGTLTYHDEGETRDEQHLDLTNMKKEVITIGKAPECDVPIPEGEGVLDLHAKILPEKREGEPPRMILEPLGKVLKGYKEIGKTPLENGMEFQIGKRTFRYTPDPER